MHFCQKSPRCALIGACAVNRANMVYICRAYCLIPGPPSVPDPSSYLIFIQSIPDLLFPICTQFLYPWHMKYVEGYTVFVFTSVRPSVCPSGVNILRQSCVKFFLYIKKWRWQGVSVPHWALALVILSINDFCTLSSVLNLWRFALSDLFILTSQHFRFDVIILTLIRL